MSSKIVTSILIVLAGIMGTTADKYETETLRSGKDFALFFVIDDYGESDMNDLKNPFRDGNSIANELSRFYGFQTEIHRNPTKTEIYTVLSAWQKQNFHDDAQLFIFFSGHGLYRDFTSQGYFVPFQSDPTNYASMIELVTLSNIVNKIDCKHTLLAIDACYSGTIDQEIAIGKGRGVKRPREMGQRDKIIREQLANKSRLLITSGGKERTPDGNDHSPFTEGILSGLRSGYTSGDGILTFNNLIGYLERVSPTPHQGNMYGHDGGGFVFVSDEENAGNKVVTDGKLDVPNIRGIDIYGFRIYDHFKEMPLLKRSLDFLGFDDERISLTICGETVNVTYRYPEDLTRKYYVEYDHPYNESAAKELIAEMTVLLDYIFSDEKMPFRFAFDFELLPKTRTGDSPGNVIKVYLDNTIVAANEDCTEVSDTTLLKSLRVFDLSKGMMDTEDKNKN